MDNSSVARIAVEVEFELKGNFGGADSILCFTGSRYTKNEMRNAHPPTPNRNFLLRSNTLGSISRC